MNAPDEAASEPRDPRVGPFEGDPREWDDALEGMSESSFAHRSGWWTVLRDVLGHTVYPLAARDSEGTLQGLLPLARVRSRLFGDYLMSMPFVSYGGAIGSVAAREALVRGAVEMAEGQGVDLLELRDRTPGPGGLHVSDRKITVLMDMPDDSELFWEKGIRSKLRSQIRRPMKEGMESRVGHDGLGDFYGVFSRTMRDLGTPMLHRRFFDSIVDSMGDCVLVSVIYHEGQPVAAGFGFLWMEEFEITWAGSLREFNRLSPNMLLYWSLVEASIERGARVFNFGRCTPGSNTHRFKQQWPSRDQPLPWAQHSPSGVLSTPSPDSPKFRIATAIWRKLPLPVANVLGPRVSRLLP